MLNKVHIRLTFFCALAMGAILLVMTCICLAVSEHGIQERNFIAFQNNSDSILNFFNGQSVISHAWLSQLEHNYEMVIDIQDGDSPLLYTELSHGNYEKILRLARDKAATDHHISPDEPDRFHLMRQETFSISDADSDKYYATVALIPKNDGYLNIALLYSITPVMRQIIRQRLLFGCGALTAWLLLIMLSWIFIKKMLHPIEENRKRQVQFIASASHELRSPLTVILSALSAAKIAVPGDRIQFFETMQIEGTRMSHLIDDMLLLANSDNHSWRMQPAYTELDTLLLETYEKYELPARQRGLQLQIALPEASVPACFCDRQRIAQALSILVENALSYTPTGGYIKLALAISDKYLELNIIDNGIGITDEQKEKIFERFYRIDRAHHDKEHFGLGLCIAREIILLHKGKIEVGDTPDGGATFTIKLSK